MKVSMRDVAEHAGVSVATVSHVINKTRYVADDTVSRVQKSIKELGYVPDPIGRMFKTGKKNLIGFIVPDIANPVWAIIIEEVEGILAKYGNKLIIINTKEDEQRELENVQLLASGIVDGLIIASTSSDFEHIKKVVSASFPMVFIDRVIPNCPCDSIVPQDYNAIYEGVEHFILSGHQRIGIITGQMRLSTSQVRLNAYQSAMEHYGLPVREEYIQYGNSLAKSAVALLPPLLKAGCTALVVSNNIMTGDVLQYLTDQGICIGQDISLLGQGVENNLDYSLRNMDLMVQPSAEIGRQAGKQILNRINNASLPIKNVVLYSRLLKRNIACKPIEYSKTN